ncbi:hypothetical protein HK102_010959 [Quaeritorhiza haematococci]|nr:hypothetical protein HK102_010959 [Quaeritorhiza haematococci]
MSDLASFIFGNVDEEGRLENDDLDEELRDSLAQGSAEFLSRFISGLDALDERTGPSGRNDGFQPTNDAIDYSEINELADEAISSTTAPTTSSTIQESPFQLQPAFNLPDFSDLGFSLALPPVASSTPKADDEYDEVEEEDDLMEELRTESASNAGGLGQTSRLKVEELDSSPVEPAPPPKPVVLAEVFPGYEQGKFLKFSELFAPKVTRLIRPAKKSGKRVTRDLYYSVLRDDRTFFHQPLPDIKLPPQRPSKPNVYKRSHVAGSPEPAAKAEEVFPASFQPVVLDSWEDRIIWEDEEQKREEQRLPASLIDMQSNDTIPSHLLRNAVLENGEWADCIIWDDEQQDESILRPLPQSYPAKDPTILPYEVAMAALVDAIKVPPMLRKHEPARPSEWPSVQPTGPPGTPRALQNHAFDKFNLSDDRFYEVAKTNRSGRVRQTYGPAKLQHALPAIKLLSAYFRTQLTVTELRSFHRPPLRISSSEEIQFSRVKSNKLKKKKLKGKEITEILKTAKDLTLKDTSKFVLMEYSEEYPPIMQNVGMASLVYNYYRKKDERDTHIPQFEAGVPYVLEQVDASPFFGFGDVAKGQTVQAIYNNLYRAPIFRHDVPATDFLVVRHTYKNQTKYYIREIPMVYVVGQTFPMVEVPRPQSRKITSTMKGRLQVAAYRLMRQDPHRRLKMDKLLKMFPGYPEAQVRQRLKEFAQFQRKGDSTGWWKLKQGLTMPNEEELRKLVSPESVCLFESTVVGEQWLRDAGYATNVDYQLENEDEEAKETMDIEVQLAPWVITRNFLQATQGKGMLKLFGAGDPTGRGEGFSFIRASMKEMFHRAALGDGRPRQYQRFSIAEQQQVYREEINRIWNTQHKSLSSKEDIVLTDEENEPADEISKHNEDDLDAIDSRKTQMELDEENERKREYGYSLALTPPPVSPPPLPHDKDGQFSDVEHDDVNSIAGSVSSRTSYQIAGKNKMLVIMRLVRDEQGELVWKSEVLTDVRVINAYMRQRTLIERQAASRSLSPSNNDEDEKKRRKKR